MKRLAVFEDDLPTIDRLSVAAFNSGCEIVGTAGNREEARELVAALAAGSVAAHYALIDGNLGDERPDRERGDDARYVLNLLRQNHVDTITVVDFTSDGFRELGLTPAQHTISKYASPAYLAKALQALPYPAE